jgi:hypothetical protein
LGIIDAGTKSVEKPYRLSLISDPLVISCHIPDPVALGLKNLDPRKGDKLTMPPTE